MSVSTSLSGKIRLCQLRGRELLPGEQQLVGVCLYVFVNRQNVKDSLRLCQVRYVFVNKGDEKYCLVTFQQLVGVCLYVFVR